MKFIDNIYEENEDGTKESTTFIRHLGLLFMGDAIAAPDEPNPSELFGGRLSEARAILHAFQYERDLREDEYHTISNFIKACSCTKAFDKDSPSAKVMFHQLNIAKKKYDIAKEKVEVTRKAIKTMMDNRDKYFEKRAKKVKE